MIYWQNMAKFDEKAQEARVSEIRQKEAEDLAQTLAKKYDIAYTDLGIIPVKTQALALVGEKSARKGGVAVFMQKGKTLDEFH